MPENSASRIPTLVSLLLFLLALLLVFASAPISQWICSFLSRHSLIAESPKLERVLEYGLDHLGLVVVAAMILKFTIERTSQLEFVRLVNDRVRQQAIKPLEDSIGKLTEGLTYRITKLLDPSLQTMLKEYVLNPTFIRPRYKLSLKLARLDPAAHPGVLKVFVGLSYMVLNVTTKTAKYSIEAWLEDIVHLAKENPIYQSDFTRIAHDKSTESDSFTIGLHIDEMKKQRRIVRGNGVLNLQIKDVAIEPDSSLFVEIEGVQLMQDQDHFVWNLITLTERLEIVVELEGGLTRDNLAIFPREMHHIGHEEFKRTQRWEGNKLTMAINQVLLPYQGIEIRWSPAPPPAKLVASN